ncbi:MAG: retropepsin-like aspartic protease [Methylococcaceae bacterium]
MQNLKAFVFTALVLLSIQVQAEPMVYKCKTEQGDLHYQKSPCIDSEAVASWTAIAKPVPKAEVQSLSIPLGVGGHYFIDGAVNNNALTFVVDTGASVVALPANLSAVNGLHCRGYVQMNTANGSAKVCVVTLAKLEFGSFKLENVTAVLMPNLSEALLGMNVLQQFAMEQREGELRLSKRD